MTTIGLGCVKLGSVAAGHGWRASIRLVHEALDRGITFFDTADAYGSGTSEHVLGDALRGRRERVTVATKGGFCFDERSPLQRRVRVAAAPLMRLVRRLRVADADAAPPSGSSSAYQSQDFSPAHLTGALEASLRRLRTDHVDVYQLHGPQRADQDAVAEWAMAMVASGKFGKLGIGAESAAQALEWQGCDAVTAVQLPYGILDPEAATAAIPELHRSGRTVIVRGALGAGLVGGSPPPWLDPAKATTLRDLRALSEQIGLDVIDLAIAFVRVRADVEVIVAGVSSPAHLSALIRAAAEPLPAPDVQRALQRIATTHQPI
jgi:aryl-alcohol dehydrogenase-like predicted oxidoreductase